MNNYKKDMSDSASPVQGKMPSVTHHSIIYHCVKVDRTVKMDQATGEWRMAHGHGRRAMGAMGKEV